MYCDQCMHSWWVCWWCLLFHSVVRAEVIYFAQLRGQIGSDPMSASGSTQTDHTARRASVCVCWGGGIHFPVASALLTDFGVVFSLPFSVLALLQMPTSVPFARCAFVCSMQRRGKRLGLLVCCVNGEPGRACKLEPDGALLPAIETARQNLALSLLDNAFKWC